MNEWELMNDGFVSFIDVSHIYKRPVHETKTFFFSFYHFAFDTEMKYLQCRHETTTFVC